MQHEYPVPAGVKEQIERLSALWDLALRHDTLDAQLNSLLQQARDALAADYVEVWKWSASGRIASSEDGKPRRPIGATALCRNLGTGPAVLFCESPGQHDPAREMLRTLGWSAVLIKNIGADEKRCTLSFAWSNPREKFLTEAETCYVNALAPIVSRFSELLEKQHEITEQLQVDPLTGLRNRTAILEHLSDALSSASRSKSRVAVVYIDLNRFKAINDSHGHGIGDKAIAETARRIGSALRRHELAGRMGGDEFAAVVAFQDEMELELVANRLLDALSMPMTVDGLDLEVGASIGIALFPDDATSASELLAHADSAMYEAKRSPTSAFAFFTPATRTAHLPEARRFILCFQPIADARSGRIVAAEALLRWVDRDRGLLSPASFGLTPEIDRAVVESLFKTERYHEITDHLPIHVNITRRTDELLSRSGPHSGGILVEIPEAFVAEDPNEYFALMEKLRATGYRVGLSGFGSRGLPFSVLGRLKVDFVKLSTDLTSPAALSTMHSANAVKAAIEYAHSFGWSVIAENVEEERQKDWLLTSGVDALQGYYICTPLIETDFARWIRYRS